MWVLFSVHSGAIGVFGTLADAERAKGDLVVKRDCGTSVYAIREMVLNKIYE